MNKGDQDCTMPKPDYSFAPIITLKSNQDQFQTVQILGGEPDKLEVGTLSHDHISHSTTDSGNNPANPNPNPKPFPKPCPTSIKITEDLTLTLVPRVKLDFVPCLSEEFETLYPPRSSLKDLVTEIFRDPSVFRKQISISDKDIYWRFVFPVTMTDDNFRVIAEGSFFFRDPKFNSKELRVKIQKTLLQKLDSYEVKFRDTVYKVRVSPPAFLEDPIEMMDSVSGFTQDPPIIIIKRIPSRWFVEESDSKPSKRLLRIFLEVFGKVWDLEIAKDARNGDTVINVLVQYEKYEDSQNALNSLCAHSLRKGSRSIANCEVSLREEQLCQSVLLEDDSPVEVCNSADNSCAPAESVVEGITRGLVQLATELGAKDEWIIMLEKRLKAGILSEDHISCSTSDSALFTVGYENEVEQHVNQSSKTPGNLDIAIDEGEKTASNKKSELKTLYNEAAANEDNVGLAPATFDSQNNPANSLNPNPNPKPFPKPCPACTRIKITENLTLTLVPCIKLDFIFYCPEDSAILDFSEPSWKHLVSMIFRNPWVFRKQISILDEDIHVHPLIPPRMIDDNFKVLAEGSFFLRDPDLNVKELRMKVQKKLLQKLGAYELKICDSVYEVRVSPRAFSEDPIKMMASVSGFTQNPPTIVLKRIPSQWFAEEPDSSKPSKRLLHIFLGTFGKVMDLEIAEDDKYGKDARNGDTICKVFVQYEKYEDCQNALNFLCAHSLQKGLSSIANYEVSWKDEELCQSVDDFPVPVSIRRSATGVESVVEGIATGLVQLATELRAKDERITILEEELKSANFKLKEVDEDIA